MNPHEIAEASVEALLTEARLAPKPGLVDKNNNGSHKDMTLKMFEESAAALYSTFYAISCYSSRHAWSHETREQIARIGRRGEQVMLETTKGVNTHKGAIWAVGLLSASVSREENHSVYDVLAEAGRLASFPDKAGGENRANTHGKWVQRQYGMHGAKREAELGFPNIRNVGLPALSKYGGIPRQTAYLNVLLALMAEVNDTCVVYRGGVEALYTMQEKAAQIISQGGASSSEGIKAMHQLDAWMIERQLSPGGCADLLAGTIFLTYVCPYDTKEKQPHIMEGVN